MRGGVIRMLATAGRIAMMMMMLVVSLCAVRRSGTVPAGHCSQ